jgi:hypothetical protein
MGLTHRKESLAAGVSLLEIVLVKSEGQELVPSIMWRVQHRRKSVHAMKQFELLLTGE